jgi:hypothetical protein
MPEVQPGRLSLADLIDAVRGELQKAATEARDAELQFDVQDVTLEVEIAATGTKGIDGGIKLWAFTLGGKASKSDTATQTVTLKLGAVNKAGGTFHVSDLSSERVRKE